jgi:hypothetical protein
LSPDFDGLFGWQFIAQLMPGGLANIGHGLNCVCHFDYFQMNRRDKAAEGIQQSITSTKG